MYEHRLNQQPDEVETRCHLAQTLSRMGGATYALQLCSHPDATEENSLTATAGAEEVRWGEGYAPTRGQQQAESEQALERLDSVIAASTPADPIWQQAQYDRLMALFDLRRMRDTTQSYERLRQQRFTVPFYARQRVADAYLALHQPEKAEDLYRQIIEHSPGDGSAWSGLAYAQLESEHVKKAFRSIDHAGRDTRVPRSVGGGAGTSERPHKIGACQRRATASAGNDLSRPRLALAGDQGNAHLR